jgi:hypothetical protein
MSLITQRKQTSQAVAELWHNTFFNRYWRAIGSFLGRGKEVPLGVSVAVVMTVNLIVGTSVSFLLRERQYLSAPVVMADLVWVTYTCFAVLLARVIHAKLLGFLHQRFVHSIKREKDIRDLQAWAEQWLGQNRRAILFGVVFAAGMAPSGFYAVYQTMHLSIGVTLIYFVNFFHLSVSVYGLFSLIAFLLRFKDWQLTLYPDDPGSTPILLEFAAEVRSYLMIYSFGIALFMLLTQLVGRLNLFNLVQFFLLNWLPILTMFVLANVALSGMITRVKHERMGEIQAQIMKLARLEKTDTKITAQIMGLMNYHDRVKGARNSLVNSQAIVNLLGSLALPAIATLIQAYVKGLFS